MTETKCDEIIESDSAPKIANYTNSFLSKIYPACYRTMCDNLKAVKYWIYGFQIGILLL